MGKARDMDNPYTAPATSGGSMGPGYAPGHAAATGITEYMLASLRETRPWVLFLAILGFITCGVMVLAGIAMFLIPSLPTGTSPFPMSVLGFVYWALVPFYLVPSLKLLKYAGAIRNLLAGGGIPALEDALLQQKTFWKLVGIFVLVGIALYLLVIIGVVAFGMMGALNT